MSTAEKLTYLNDTKQLLKENINNLGGNLTTEPFRQYASVLEGIYERLPKVSGIGASLSLSPSMVGKIKLNEIQGNTLQNGTPTPSSPVPIQSVTGLQNVEVCGKNLLPVSLIESQVINGLTITNLGDGTIKINGTTTNTTRIDVSYTQSLIANTTYKFINSYTRNSSNANVNIQDVNSSIIGIITLNNTNSTFTSNSDVEITKMRLYIDSSQTFDNYILKVMLIKSTETETFEPYKGNTYEVNLGKNLFNLTSINDYDSGVASLNNNIITLNWSAGYNLDINDALSNLDSTKTYTISFKHKGNAIYLRNNSAGTTNILYTSNDSEYALYSITLTNITSFQFRFVRKDTTGTAYIKDFQIEAGSVATSYSEYFTPIELNKIGDYKDSIKKSTGKNLFDKDNANIFNGYLNGNEGIVSNNNNRITYIQIENDKTYTISKVLSNRFRIGLTNSVPSNNLQINDYSSQDNQTSYTFTNTSYKYLCIWFWTNTDTLTEQRILDSIMIEENNQATTYEPYGKVWYVEKQIGKVVLDGSETYETTGTNTSGKYKIRYDGVANLIKKPANANTIGDIISNQFISLSASDTYRCSQGISVEISGKISFYDETLTQSTSAFKTWLSTHNTEVLYVLNTPEYTEITNTELIEDLETLYTAKSQEGTTNISITSEDLEMILNVSALKGDA